MSERATRRRPFGAPRRRVVAFNALPVRPGVYDGAATFSLNVLQRLPDAMPDVDVVGYVAEGEDRLEARPNLELRHIGEGSVHAAHRVALETLWLSLDLRRLGAGALISPHESIPLRAPCPVVVVAQNLVYHREAYTEGFLGAGRSERWGSTLRGAYYRRRMTEAYAKAAAVVAVSRHTAEVLAARSRLDLSKTTVVHEGSDSLYLPESGDQERDERLLVVSSLTPYKRLEATIDLFARLRERRPHLELDIAGGDWRGFRGVLASHAAQRGVADHVRFLGAVAPAELAELYARSCLLLHLSECESFGLPVVEAMRFGLPVVAADRSSLPEVAGGAAALVDPDDLDSALVTVESVLDHRLEELRALGYARSAELTWSATAEGIRDAVLRVARFDG